MWCFVLVNYLCPIRRRRSKRVHHNRIKKDLIASFDVETKGGDKNVFYSCGIRDEDGFSYYTDKNEAIKHLIRLSRYYKYVFATNLNFDFESLFIDTIYYFRLQRIYSGSRLIGGILKTKAGELWLSDTLNFAMMSLAKLGESVGVPKLEHPSFLGKKPKNKKEREELKIYNERDCEVTYLFMKLIQKEVRALGGEIKLTGGSTAMFLFRSKYLKKTIFKEHFTLENEKILNFIRSSLYGGRTEVFIRGLINASSIEWKEFTLSDTPKLLYYDINSMYPAVMLYEYPDPNSAKYWPKGYRKSIDYFEGVSRVRVRTTKDLHIPYLPYRLKNGRLIFPLGEFEGTYTHVELREAMKQGYEILNTYETVYYRRKWLPFKDYVKDLYALRMKYKKEANPAEMCIKILLNSLYGKFSQKHVSDITFHKSDDILPHTHYMIHEGETSPRAKIYYTTRLKYVVMAEECDAGHVFPILSAYVTSYARRMLYGFLSKTKPIYCDTDSIVTYKELPTSIEVGKMKLEDELKTACYLRPKLYAYENIKGNKTFKAKGVPRMDEEKFKTILEGKTVFYKKILRTKEAYKRGLLPNEAVKAFKNLNLHDVKRSWKKDFDPFIFEESKPLIIKE